MYVIEALRKTDIPDLALKMEEGDAEWITEEQFRSSLCVAQLQRIGTIRVSSGERSRVTKKPARPKAHGPGLSRPGKRGPAPPPPAPAPPPTTVVKVVKVGIPAAEVEGMIQRAAAAASEATAERILAGLPQQQTLVVNNAGPASSTAPSTLGDAPEEPMFIPKGMVTDEENDLHIEAESSEAEGLGDAAAALKALRKGQK